MTTTERKTLLAQMAAVIAVGMYGSKEYAGASRRQIAIESVKQAVAILEEVTLTSQ